MAHAIEVEHLKKTFKGGVRALDGVTFAVEEGSVFGLLGPNGAGKTTVVRILTTILLADSGSARVLGMDVTADAEKVRRSFGLAGQFAAVDENLTGRENLKMIGRLNSLSRPDSAARAAELLGEFQLTDAAERPLKTYSGGMRRRLDIAAALVARPKVLFLDEPTTGLDPQSRLDLWGVVNELVESGTTVLLTTQYLEEADQLAKRIAVVDHGQVISEGTPAELKQRLGATVLELGLADEQTAQQAAGLLAEVGSGAVHVFATTVELNLDRGPLQVMDALRLLDQALVTPLRFQVREPSLDDVFLSLTGHQATEEPSTAEEEPSGGRRAKRAGR